MPQPQNFNTVTADFEHWRDVGPYESSLQSWVFFILIPFVKLLLFCEVIVAAFIAYRVFIGVIEDFV
jgi:hypothetical protein